MMTNYRELLNIKNLKSAVNLEKLDLRQKKAARNIKYCANDQWQFVNSYLDDSNDAGAREYMMDAEELFVTVYSESLKNVYDEGSVHFGTGAEAFLKDVKFCGKEFLEKATLYYVAQFLEESVEAVDGTEEDAKKVLADLQRLYAKVYRTANGDELIEGLASRWECKVKKTRSGQKWIEISLENAAYLRELFVCDSEAIVETKKSKITIEYKDGRKYELKISGKPYLWSIGA